MTVARAIAVGAALLGAPLAGLVAEPATREQIVERLAAGERDFGNLEAPGVDLEGVDFHGSRLFGANLKGAKLSTHWPKNSTARGRRRNKHSCAGFRCSPLPISKLLRKCFPHELQPSAWHR